MSLNYQQQQRLLEWRESKQASESQKISEIIVDGEVIKGYFEYTYFDEKTYPVSPTRSTSGRIDNLDSYATFITPTLKISFKALSINMYRKIMRLIKEKNEFTVTAYSPVDDKFVTNNMYFAPDEYPELYIYDLKVLAIIDYVVELIGTNTDVNKVSIVYHSNPPSGAGNDTTYGTESFAKNLEVLIGDGADSLKTLEGYKFQKWNTKADGTGDVYIDGGAYTITQDLVLYAQWAGSSEYTISYNYGLGVEGVDENGEPLTSKTISIGSYIGTLPSTLPNTVEYDGNKIQAYEPLGWFWVARWSENATEITSTTKYNIQGNATIYQLFKTKSYTITYNSQGANYTPNSITQEYGSTIYVPPEPTKDGYDFVGWYKVADPSNADLPFEFTTMPPANITLYAVWSSK